MNSPINKMYRLNLFGTFSLVDPHGRDVPLRSAKGRAMLAFLALPAGRMRSREEIMALLWSDRGEAQARASLRQTLAGLRKDLGQDGSKIFRIDADCIALDPEKVEIAAAEEAPLLVGLRISDPAFDEWLRDERQKLEGNADAPRELAPEKPIVAVLPLQCQPAGSDIEYLADGFTVDIATLLCRFRTISVLSSWMTAHSKTDYPKPEELRDKFGAAFAVCGSVRTLGTLVRISIQLIETNSLAILWAENFDCGKNDVFAIQDEVTSRIVETVAGQIESRHREAIPGRNPERLSNHQTLLLAEQVLRKRSKNEIRNARVLFNKVINVDPENARARSGLARTYLDEIWSYWGADVEDLKREAFREAQKAVDLDPIDARARINLAVAYMIAESEFDRALTQFDKARELNPNDAELFCQNAWCCALSGDLEGTKSCSERSLTLLPYDRDDCTIAKAIATYLHDDYDGCLELLRDVTSGSENLDVLIITAACSARLGRLEEASTAAAKFIRSAEPLLIEQPGTTAIHWERHIARVFPFRETNSLQKLLDPLREAGIPI